MRRFMQPSAPVAKEQLEKQLKDQVCSIALTFFHLVTTVGCSSEVTKGVWHRQQTATGWASPEAVGYKDNGWEGQLIGLLQLGG